MDTELKEQLIQVEGQIKELCPAKDYFDQLRMVANLSSKEKEQLVTLLRTRRCLLNRMLLGTPAEVARMREVNNRLIDLTEKLHDKTYSLYKALLQTGYDPDFDDEIMIEGTLTYIVDSWEKDESDLDVLRMNDFWCEIKVNHQMLCNFKGERHSIINRSEDDN